MPAPCWTPKTTLAGVFFCAFLAGQVVVPLLQLWSPRPARFAWHMFAGIRQPLQYDLVLSDGSVVPVHLQDHLGNFRSDLDTMERLPAHLCARYPQAVAVRFRVLTETAFRSFACR
jgi:hypothetical protein